MAEEVDYPALVAAEYGQYVATQNIYYDGALAYTEGQAVPASNVKQHGYSQNGLVKKVASATEAKASAAADTAKG